MPNEATSFAESIVENFHGVFLGQGHFEETLHYTPVGGVERTLSGVAQYASRYETTGDQSYLVEELLVLVGRDPDADCGGIDAPQIGDKLRRAADASTVIYGYSGEKPQGNAAGWTLKFTRRMPYQLGRRQTQG